MSKTIGILTSGGDCAGLNAIIRAAVRRAHLLGYTIYGIENGTHGLLSSPPRVRKLDCTDVGTDMMRMGGTILGTTNKGDPFAFPMADGSIKDVSGTIIDSLKSLGMEAVIGIGGDGSIAILKRLADQGGFNLVGIPKTIDNDLGSTEMAVGFDTAVSVATEALDRLQPTAASHDRIMVLEVMGRDAGHIALHAGVAGGADIILIPEIPYSLQKVADKVREIKSTGRNYVLVVVSEALRMENGEKATRTFADGQSRYGGIGGYISDRLAHLTGFEARETVLGHVQRGCPPTHTDRMIASAFGVYAVDLIAQGKYGRMVSWSDRRVIDVPIESAIASYRAVEPDDHMLHTAKALGISFGD